MALRLNRAVSECQTRDQEDQSYGDGGNGSAKARCEQGDSEDNVSTGSENKRRPRYRHDPREQVPLRNGDGESQEQLWSRV